MKKQQLDRPLFGLQAQRGSCQFSEVSGQRSEIRDQGTGTLGDLHICSVRERWVILRKLKGSFLGGLPGKRAEDGRQGELVFLEP